MNKYTNSVLSDILGSFWTRVFGNLSLVSWVKHYLSDILLKLENIYIKAIRSTNVTSTHKYSISPRCAIIPVNDCIVNMSTISDTEYFSGPVNRTSKVRSVGIPKKYINRPRAVQKSLDTSSHVWIHGINMFDIGDFTVLYLGDTVDLIQEVMSSSSGDILPVYKLYIIDHNNLASYDDCVGILCDHAMDNLKQDDAIEVWKSYINGPTQYTINKLLSSGCGNAICSDNTIVFDSWSECGSHYVIDSEGVVYSGHNEPVVSIGDTLAPGDFIFDGVSVWDKDNIPGATDIPILTIHSRYGDLYAYNVLEDPIDIGHGYIPNMHNYSWEEALKQHTGTSMLDSDNPINAVEYSLRSLFPGNGIMYGIKGKILDISPLVAAYSILSRNAYSSPISNITHRASSCDHEASAEVGSIEILTHISNAYVGVSPVADSPVVSFV